MRLLTLLTPLLFAAQVLSAQQTTPSKNNSPSRAATCVVSEEELQVYAALFERDTDEKEVSVLVAGTPAIAYGLDDLNLRLAANGHGLPPELREDFSAKNKVACKVTPSPLLGNLKFLSTKEETAMIARPDFWTAFHRRYGKNASIYSVSRVGFAKDKNLAALYLSSGSASNAWAKGFYLLEKKDGRWQIKLQMQVGGV